MALYTQALVWAPRSERLLSNRSAAYAAIGQFKSALEDAVKCDLVEAKNCLEKNNMLIHVISYLMISTRNINIAYLYIIFRRNITTYIDL